MKCLECDAETVGLKQRCEGCRRAREKARGERNRAGLFVKVNPEVVPLKLRKILAEYWLQMDGDERGS